MTTITKEEVKAFIEQIESDLANGWEAQIFELKLARIALAALDADKPELKIAELINKFYERYPLASFNKDTDRAEALGYFLAGAELQCFGEFIKYEELFGDE
ncbi:hypothetical protein CHT23_002689 [Salmonella enterica subsp. houtenae serovar 48:z4,z32:-]|uniref:Uncharacterized protein n=1 Tax=Salmonella enterica subsp. houtenae serovar 48:z4,z32:- TaxID=2577535 RepID=A0A729G380_SALHO|nr:hypothetical protein [Salmonella enterica subsp. houtenae]EAN3147904.1 hypothetical protein [Salmonella enterica]EDU9324686.1 hypothetical protein [Salmonella enterica subsp. enterica]EDW4110754.1 hypothetical protein [Salmonella enterica subsp. arizonae]EDW5430784.1 hypothetical protein [Salmonella enterica subsp. enterica serovar Djakarta]EEE1664932.1 hypothetical protein [Salmonella enterica subsp. houtenae serovar 48:z4,z32:-]